MEGGESSEAVAIFEREVAEAYKEVQWLPSVRAWARFQLLCRARGLTPAEERVAYRYAWGLVTDDVAHVLYLSRNTVKTHHLRARRKLGGTPRQVFSRMLREALESESPRHHPHG